MRGDELAAKLRERGYKTFDDVLFALETLDRSEFWVYVACEEDGTLVNATGVFRDEHAAFLAGEQYRREWAEHSPDDPDGLPVVKTIPLFIDKGANGG